LVKAKAITVEIDIGAVEAQMESRLGRKPSKRHTISHSHNSVLEQGAALATADADLTTNVRKAAALRTAALLKPSRAIKQDTFPVFGLRLWRSRLKVT
jgi:hypothetical protein